MYYSYRALAKGEYITSGVCWPGAIGFGATREDAEYAYYMDGGKRFVDLVTTHKSQTPFAVTDTVKQRAIESHYLW